MNRPASGTVQANPVTPHPPSSADFVNGGSGPRYICDLVFNIRSAISFNSCSLCLRAFES